MDGRVETGQDEVFAQNPPRLRLGEALVAIRRGVDDRRLAHHQIRHEMAGARADAEAVS